MLEKEELGWEDGRFSDFPVQDHPLKKQDKEIFKKEEKKKGRKTTVTSHTTHFDHPVLHLEAYKCITVH